MPKPPTRSAVTLDRLSDRALIARAATDEAAFAVIVSRYRELLRRHAARYVGEADAEDVVQQALVNASLALRRDPDREIEPKSWLYKVTTNAAIDHRRAQSVRPLAERPHEEVDLDALNISTDGDPHAVFTRRESVRSMFAGIRGLAPNQRRAATARFLEGRSHDEIADELGVSKGAARELIHRARRNLRDAIPALSPLPLFARLRDSLTGLFAGSGSVGGAKLAAGAVCVVAAAGAGGIAITKAIGDDDAGAPAAVPARSAAPTAALPEVSDVASTPTPGNGGGGDASSGGNRGGSGGDGGGSASGSGSATPAPATTGSGGGPTAPASGDSAGGTGGSSDPVGDLGNQLGVGGVTDQLGQATDQVGAGVNGAGGQLGVDAPEVNLPNNLPNAGELLGGN